MLAVVSFAGVSAGCTADAEFRATSAAGALARTLSAPDSADSLLFVAQAAHGRIVVDDHGRGTLSMDDIDHVTWFSDRPERDAGVSTMRQALESYGWRDDGDALGDDAPNATLTAHELGDDALVLELLTATVDADRVSFQVRTVSDVGARDGQLTALDLFIDTTTPDAAPSTDAGERPDPTAVAAAVGFENTAPLADHLRGLLVAVGAGPGAGPDLLVRLAVRASAPLAAGGPNSTVPVLVAPEERAGFDPTGIAEEIEQWIATNVARIDTLEFDVVVEATDPPGVLLDVQDVELPLENVELPST